MSNAWDMSTRTRALVIVDAWKTVKAELQNINGQWLPNYHDKSVSFRHRRLGHCVKVTLDGEIFVDVRISPTDYRSQVHKTDLKSAAAMCRKILQTFQ